MVLIICIFQKMIKIKINYFSHVSELLWERNKLLATTKPQNSASLYIPIFKDQRTKNHLLLWFYGSVRNIASKFDCRPFLFHRSKIDHIFYMKHCSHCFTSLPLLHITPIASRRSTLPHIVDPSFCNEREGLQCGGLWSNVMQWEQWD